LRVLWRGEGWLVLGHGLGGGQRLIGRHLLFVSPPGLSRQVGDALTRAGDARLFGLAGRPLLAAMILRDAVNLAGEALDDLLVRMALERLLDGRLTLLTMVLRGFLNGGP